MDKKHKDFLLHHRSTFVRTVDVDSLIPYLQSEEILSEKDIEELQIREASAPFETSWKAEKLLDILPTRGSRAFHVLCIALESTYPHLLTVMFLGMENNLTDAINFSSVESEIESRRRNREKELHATPSQQSAFGREYELEAENGLLLKADFALVHDCENSHMDLHKGDTQLRRLPISGDSKVPSLSALPKHANSTPFDKDGLSASCSDKTLSSRRDYERLRTQCDAAMREVQSLRRQHGDTMRKCDTAMKEADFYRKQHKLAIGKLDQQQSDAIAMKSQHSEVLAEKHRLEQEVLTLQKFCEEDRKEVAELRRQQQESMNGNGSSEAIIAALRKSEAMKDDYDALRKRYADLIASHSAAASKLEFTQEEVACLKKQMEVIMQEKEGAIRERNGLKQQCTSAIRQWDIALRERNEAKEALAKVQQQRDEAMKEINQAMAVRIKATKDLARLTEERNAAVQEYSLTMSERDSVHKEIEKLHEELALTTAKIKTLEAQKKISFEEVETLRREIASALNDRDKAIKQCNDLREKYEDNETSRSDSIKDREEQPKDYDYYHMDRDLTLKSRNELLELGNLTEMYSKTQKERMENLDQANQEIDRLRKQAEKLQIELNEASQEAEVSKRRRDWAFNERDKIVQERESIRTLCDKLRRERDRAVSDLAEALRDSDDIKKQRNEASKEVKELREKIEAQMEKESRIKHLNFVGHNHSRDSAIDADLQEWETETLDIEIGASNEDDLGFELAGGRDDPQFPDCAIFVSNVIKGSPADGKLRANDCLCRINNVDVTNCERRTAMDAVRNSGGIISLVIRRRRLTSSRFIQSVQLNLGAGKEHGLNLETGVYVSRIAPGSVAAKEGSMALGDRVVSINGRFLDGIRSGTEAMKLLDVSGEIVVLALLKSVNSPSAPMSSSSSGHNIQDNIDAEKSSSPKSYTVTGSPMKEHSYTGNGREHAKKLTTSSSQTEELAVMTSPQRQKNAADGKGMTGSPPQNFIDKFFGVDRRSTKERSKDKKLAWTSSPLQEEQAIAELDSVIDHYKKSSNSKANVKIRKKREKETEKNGGTWPKYRGPPLEFLEANQGAMTHVHRKRERVSIASLLNAPKLSTFYDSKKQMERDRDREHERERLRERREREIERERGGRDVDVDRLTGSRRSSVGSSGDRASDRERSSFHPYNSEGIGATVLPLQPNNSPLNQHPSRQFKSTGHFLSSPKSSYQTSSIRPLDGKTAGPIHFSTNSILESHLDYSVVSANRDKEVLEFYKNKKTRPNSSYLPNNGDRFASPDGLVPYKPPSLDLQSLYNKPSHQQLGHLSRGELSPTDPLNFSPRLSERAVALHSRAPSHPCYTSGTAHAPSYYTVSSSRMQHNYAIVSHPHANMTSASSSSSAGVGSPSPRYSSPPTLPCMSRSGESLLGASIPETSPVPDARTYFQRYGVNPSPSPSPLHYGFNHSPSHSMDLQHFHPIPKRMVPNHPVSSYRGGESTGFVSYDGPATIPKRSNHRIRIPSNQSVTSKSSASKLSSSSIERASTSERNSPMPAFHVETITPGGSIVHWSISDFHNKKPSPGELRNIRIDKNAEDALGINIDGGPRGGIFVSSVSENSIAAQAGICIGDQLLDVCGINMRSATYLLAANVLRQCGDSITMLVQYNPEKYHEALGMSASSSSEESPVQTPTPSSSPKVNQGPLQLLDLDDMPVSASSTLKRQNTLISSKSKDGPVGGDIYAPRYVFLKTMTTSNLGITFLGGNAVGIFVHQVQCDSPANCVNGLRCGDQILEYNGIDLKHATAEQAAYELAKRAETITVLAQFNIERYNEIQHLPGDSIYIRAMFDHQAENPNELGFHKDDILFVDNTMFNGVPGLWRAWILDEEGHKTQCGAIPSKYKVEEDLVLRRSLGELDSESGSRRSAMSARRSFFRRYRKHQRSNSRDIKELASFSDASINSFSDSGNLIEDPPILTYQRVERLTGKANKYDVCLRPVLILGPLIDIVLDKLVQDFPRKFARCISEAVDASAESMENGLQENRFVDYRRRGSHFECITLSAIREYCDKNCHCIIDVSPAAIERLQRNQIYPIVLFIKFKSTKQIREVKDPRLLTEKVSTKAAKEMYEHSMRLENEFKHYISAVIPGGNLAYMCAQIQAQVDQEQNKAVWVQAGAI